MAKCAEYQVVSAYWCIAQGLISRSVVFTSIINKLKDGMNLYQDSE